MSVACRRATGADVGAIHRLLVQMATEVGRTVAVTPAILRAQGFGPTPRFRALLAEAEGQAVGLVLCYPEFSSWRGQVGLYVQDLYVQPQARGRGLAHALMAAAWADAADWGPEYLTLMVDHRNTAAQDWYARRGFALRERGDLLILQGAALDRLGQREST